MEFAVVLRSDFPKIIKIDQEIRSKKDVYLSGIASEITITTVGDVE